MYVKEDIKILHSAGRITFICMKKNENILSLFTFDELTGMQN